MQLKELPIEDRPRERLSARGGHSLSDKELLAILLGSGGKGRDVFQISADLLPLLDGGWENLSPEILCKVEGIGHAKACMLIASLEFARRRIRPKGIRITQAVDVIPLISHLKDRDQEHFICISLNGAHEVIACRTVTIGLLNSTQVHPREVFSDPLKDRACAIVVAHNHPSGKLSPSSEDKVVTKTLKQAGELLGIKLLDHIIFSDQGFYSFAEENEL